MTIKVAGGAAGELVEEGLVDLVEGIVGQDLIEGEPAGVAGQEVDGGTEAGGVVEHHRFDPVVGGDEAPGVEIHGAARVEGADLQVPAADGQHHAEALRG